MRAIGRGMTAVEHRERRPRSRLHLARAERRREQLGEEARAAHSAPHDVVEVVELEVAGEREERVGLALHVLRLVEPTQPVRDLGRVVLPERVVAGGEARDGLSLA